MIDEALLRVLSTHTGRPETFVQRPSRMPGGFWAAIYSFELAAPPAGVGGPHVLRVMPNHDAAIRETIVQRSVAEQGYPTPGVVLDGFDEGLGGAFMVMKRVDGISPLDGLGFGRAMIGLPKTLRRLPQQLSTAAARLHDLDARPIIDSLEMAGVDIAALGVAARLDEIGRAAQASSEGFGALLAWLDRYRPVLTPAVLCHGDIHPFNLLVTADGSFTVLDWTNASVCRREFDVGLTAALLRSAPITVPRIAEHPVAAILGSLARRFIDAYRTTATIDLNIVEWFEALQYGRCLAAVATAHITEDGIVGPSHPFRKSAPAMIRHLHTITGVTVDVS
jgi:aminoglycoside phosphotransferase (APT) family kinase protein